MTSILFHCILSTEEFMGKLGMVRHSCNPSYLKGRAKRIPSSRLTPARAAVRPCLKKQNKSRGAKGTVQIVECLPSMPGFNPGNLSVSRRCWGLPACGGQMKAETLLNSFIPLGPESLVL
jgi:hypothetical protein